MSKYSESMANWNPPYSVWEEWECYLAWCRERLATNNFISLHAPLYIPKGKKK